MLKYFECTESRPLLPLLGGFPLSLQTLLLLRPGERINKRKSFFPLASSVVLAVCFPAAVPIGRTRLKRERELLAWTGRMIGQQEQDYFPHARFERSPTASYSSRSDVASSVQFKRSFIRPSSDYLPCTQLQPDRTRNELTKKPAQQPLTLLLALL